MSIFQDLLNNRSFFLIAGPCVVENEEITFQVAESLKKTCHELEIPFIFKASYRKANRSDISSFAGIGDHEALLILQKVKQQLQLPVITDIHLPEEAALAAQYVDMLQIPAFLCRQTDLLLAAAKTMLPVNIKKGQFLAPEAMKFAAEKVKSAGNDEIFLTERGTSFGYGDLVVDYRSIPTMQKLGYPVILDCTHSLQQPNQNSGVTGGVPQFIPTIAKAGIATGVNGIFIETHPDPSKALSDGANMLPLKDVHQLLSTLKKIHTSLNE